MGVLVVVADPAKRGRKGKKERYVRYAAHETTWGERDRSTGWERERKKEGGRENGMRLGEVGGCQRRIEEKGHLLAEFECIDFAKNVRLSATSTHARTYACEHARI